MTGNPTIRSATTEDLELIVDLCSKHAEFEKVEYDRSGKAQKLKTALFSETPELFCLVVEMDSRIVGFATYMKQFSTWEAENYVYMDCLFLRKPARGRGVGERLINRIKDESRKTGCLLIQWQTPSTNMGAIKFYRRIGAASKSKKRFFLNI